MKTEKKWTNSEDNFLIKKNASVFSTYKSISTLENKDQKSKQNS
jgi:hypothetical protein